MKARWVPAAVTTAAFVVVALVASQGHIDVSVLIWTAVGVFGLVFGIATVGSARHADHAPSGSVQSSSVQDHARRVAAAQEPVARAATGSGTAAVAAAAPEAPPADVEAPRTIAAQAQAPAESEPALTRRSPKHAAELPA